jgi:hypothetical protein
MAHVGVYSGPQERSISATGFIPVFFAAAVNKNVHKFKIEAK